MSDTPCHIPAAAFQGWPGRDRLDTPEELAAALLAGRTRAVAMYRSDLAMARTEFRNTVTRFSGTRIRSPRVEAFRALALARRELASAIERETAARIAVEGFGQ